jgi:hypothetical protein
MKNLFTKRFKAAILLMILSGIYSLAQSPSVITYQAIIRDNNGVPIVDADKTMKFSILQGSTSGTLVYWETQAVRTNSFGLVNAKIGSSKAGIETINWAAGPYFLKVEVDALEMGITQIFSVPYSLYAQKAGNGFSGLYNDLTGKPDLGIYLQSETDPIFNGSVAKTITATDLTNWNTAKWIRSSDSLYYLKGNVGIGTKDPRSTLSVTGTTPNDSAIFEVRNNNGLTVFAVYNDGVRIYIDETAKGATKGGFAIGGFSSVKGVIRDYMRVTGDSIRMYLDNTAPVKGAPKGGFAIGGFDKGKASNARYMNISTDGGSSAGFNTFIGYKSGGLGSGGLYNIAIGRYAGYYLDFANATLGRNNIFIGDSAGFINNSGFQNIYIGKYAGATASAGYHNVYIGYKAGSEGHGQYNTFIGDEAGRYNNNGWSNVFVGNAAGASVTSGSQNTLLGTQSGWKIGTGTENTFIGNATGFGSVNSSGNTFIGSQAGDFNISGNNNVYVGKWSGMQATGSGNIFIGANSGYNVTTGDNQLMIDNSTSSTATSAIISGDMGVTKKLRFNADVSIKTSAQTGYAFYVNGTAGGTLPWSAPSDARLKTNIQTISNPLEKVLALRGVSFEWIDPSKFASGPQIGFIAQEAINVLPEIVNKNGDYYSMQYSPVTALLVEAVKELKKENDLLKEKVKKIDDLQEQIDALRASVTSSGNK